MNKYIEHTINYKNTLSYKLLTQEQKTAHFIKCCSLAHDMTELKKIVITYFITQQKISESDKK